MGFEGQRGVEVFVGAFALLVSSPEVGPGGTENCEQLPQQVTANSGGNADGVWLGALVSVEVTRASIERRTA